MNLFRHLIIAGALFAACVAHAGPKEDIQADLKAGRWTQAEQRLNVVLKKHPRNALAHFWMAQVQEKLGHLEAARAELAAAREIDPAETFVGDRAFLQRFEDRIAPPPKPAPAVAAQEPAAVPAPTEPAHGAAAAPDDGLPMAAWLAIGLAGAGLVYALARRGRAAGVARRRAELGGRLNEAKRVLADALAWSDGHPGLTQEAKLANYTRANLAIGEISTQLATLSSRTQFAETESLVMRSLDIAADIRGEERPSERAAREQRADAQRREAHERALAEAEARRPVVIQPHVGQGGPGGAQGPGLLGGAAIIGGAALAGGLLGRAHAADRDRDTRDMGETIPAPYFGNDMDIDVGGADGPDGGNWDSGGSSDGGSGDSGGSSDTSFD